MRMKHPNHRWIWILLFSFIILIQLLHEFEENIFNPNNYSFQLIHAVLSIGAIALLSLMLRYINKTNKELRESNQKLQNIFDTLDVAIWSHDLKANILLITPGIQKLYGYSLEEFYKDHELWRKVIFPEDLHVLKERETKLSLGKPVTSVYRITRPDGEVRWIQDRGIPKLDGKGNLLDFTSVLFDITDRKESEDRYKSLVEMSPDLIAVISKGNIDYINETGSRLLGASSPLNLIGSAINSFIPEQIIEDILLWQGKNKVNGYKSPYEFKVKCPDGVKRDVEITTMPILYEGRLATQVIGRDISERKKVENTIHHMAYYDSLTELPNRNLFRQHLTGLFELEITQTFAILFLDLDRFKMVNDTKGHTTGDKLLKEVAKRLNQTIKSDGIVFRQGGDEFIILLTGSDKENVIEVAERILANFSLPIEIDELEFFVTTSIGISMYPEDGKDEDTIIKHADTAMYLAKERGKNNYQFYNNSFDEHVYRKIELENGLRKAIEKNQLIIYYQPQIDLKTKQIIGVEALIRWEHPQLGMISPREFIPLAEETGLIVPIGKWVIKSACNKIKQWQNDGVAFIPIAINISVRQIQDEHFIKDVKEIIQETKLDPQWIELEITESIMQDIEKSTYILNQLKQLGVILSIDDFGTGYSSLSYLKHLPIDNIKIDKSFVDDIIDESNQGSIVKAIIDMSHNMKFKVIAEGVETEEQVKFLLENSCQIGQGFYFCQPLPADQLEILLQENTINV
jgi:diguanylate cyclase (GGDEF)-like protein/PAS domain S-box-containing protein